MVFNHPALIWQLLKHKKQHALFEALEKLKAGLTLPVLSVSCSFVVGHEYMHIELILNAHFVVHDLTELMLLGFISLMLTVFQGAISRICVPTHLISYMLPCKAGQGTKTSTPEHQQPFHENSIRRHLSSSAPNNDRCAPKVHIYLIFSSLKPMVIS